jgi:hypothetical protein
MTDQHIFMSYSREQFYFVESLALSLQSYGLTLWFDVQRIYPGADWEQAITEGLLASSELVLVASRSALASPHVRKEWEQALAMHIPIYIALFEPISLPIELQQATIIDMRSKFEQKASLLAKLLLTKQRDYHENFFAHRAFWQPVGPLSVITPLWISALLSTAGLTLISASSIMKIAAIPHQPVLQVSATLAIFINWSVLSAFILILPWRFTRRKIFNSGMYTLSIYVLPIDVVALLVFNLFFFHRIQSYTSDIASALQDQYILYEYLSMLFVGAGLLLGVRMVWVLRTIRALHWFRTGSAPDTARWQANQKWLLKWQLTPTPSKARTYRLYYHPDNKHIADDIITALDKNPYLQRGTGLHSDYQIAILTSNVTVSSFRRLLHSAQHLVCIIGTNIQLPEDGRPSLRLQWIDYRQRQPEQLQSLVNLLHHGSIYVKGYAFSVLPESMEHKILPEEISLLAILFRYCAASSASISLFILFFTWNLALRVAIALITLLCGIYIFQNADRLENYTLSHRTLKINYVLVLLCTLFFDSLAIFIVPGASYLSLARFLSLSISANPLIAIAILFLGNFFLARKWNLRIKNLIRIIILIAMLSILSQLCFFFSIPIPSYQINPWIYTVAPSTVIACSFTAFVLSFPFMHFVSLRRIYSLLPPPARQNKKTHTEPTLAVQTHSWSVRAFYLLLALEIALLFLTQL